MSKLNNKGFLSGHIGNIVYREVNGRQIVQSMPSHYHDAKTALPPTFNPDIMNQNKNLFSVNE